VLGLGVPPAASFLALEDEETKAGPAPNFLAFEDEETKAYDTQAPGGAALSALLAECQSPPTSAHDSSAVDPPTTSRRGPRSASLGPQHHVSHDSNHDVHAMAESNQEPRIEAWSDASDDLPGVARARPRSLRRRSFLPKFVFAVIVIAGALVLASVFSARENVPWLDPRPLLSKGLRVVKDKIPWERLPKVPGL